MYVFDNLGIKHIYSNPYYPKGNTTAKSMYNSQLEWADTLLLATYCYITPSVDDLKSPFYLVHGTVTLEGRLSNLQNYCRHVGDQPG